MIDQLQPQFGERALQAVGHIKIFLRGCRRAVRMIMRQRNACRTGHQGTAGDLVAVHLHPRMSAAGDLLALEHTSRAIHIGGQQHFLPLGAQLRHEIRADAVIGVQFIGKLLHFRHIRLITVKQRKAQVQQLRRARTDAFDRLQLVLGCLEHRMQ